jgi:hypothetical protein
MSAKLQAIELLTRWVEMDTSGLAGTLVDAPEHTAAVRLLRREGLLTELKPAASVNCRDCCEDLAKVGEKLSAATYRGFCDTCGAVEIPASYVQRHRVNLSRVVSYLANGLGLTGRPQEIIDQHAWLLGRTVSKRDIHAWYFGCRLDHADVADQLRSNIEMVKAAHAGTVLTTTALHRLQRTPLRDLDLVPLDSVALLGAMRFEIDRETLNAVTPQLIQDAHPDTTLRYVAEGQVFIDRQAYPLEPRQQKIIAALIAHPDHEMSLGGLRAAVDTQSQTFSPGREFGRNKVVYETFIRYLVGDKVYQLIIPEADVGWL